MDKYKTVYNKLKKVELVEILAQLDADEIDEGHERTGLSRFTRAELIAEAQRRDPDEDEDTPLSTATAAQVVDEWDKRAEPVALIEEFEAVHIFAAAENASWRAFDKRDAAAYETLAERVIDSQPGETVQDRFTLDNAMEFKRQMCDLAGLGYHAHESEIINFIADKLKIDVIC